MVTHPKVLGLTLDPMVSSWFPSSLLWSLLKKYVCPALNCWLNFVASCLDDENEIPLKVIASFSASRFALPSITLIVLHRLVRSVFWSMVSTKSLHFCSLCTQIRFWMALFNLGSSGEVGSLLRRSGHLVCSSRPVYLLVQVPYGICGVL